MYSRRSSASSSEDSYDLYYRTFPSSSSAAQGAKYNRLESGCQIGRRSEPTLRSLAMDADKFSELLDGERVDIYVGPNRQHWNLPQKLLCHHSSFFERAFTGNFQEGVDKSIEMMEDDAAAFKLLVQWMFANTIDKPKRIHEVGVTGRPQMVRPSPEVEHEMMRKGAKPAGDRKSMNMEVAGSGSAAEDRLNPWTRAYHGMWVYVKLYVLADKLGMVGLQDHTIDLLGDGTIYFFLPEIVIWIYQNTAPSSPLRKCAASLACSASLLNIVVPEYYGAIFASCDKFNIDMIDAFVHHAREIIYSGDPVHDRTCALHKHKNGEACPRGDIPTAPAWKYRSSILIDESSPQ